jgi:predicted DNA-binding transcriptional regulator YafY
MAQDQRDTMAYRLSQILIKLNQGEKLSPETLAEEFGVHRRTIQRDLKVRLAYLPLTKRNGRYALDAAFLGKFTLKDIKRFASLVGVNGLFPAISHDFLRDILDERRQPVWLIKGPDYEDLSSVAGIFKQLEQAIARSRLIALEIAHFKGKIKRYEAIAPYRLLNVMGIWYLAAVHQGKRKTFGVGKLRQVEVSDALFEKDPAIAASIRNLDF